MPTPQTIAHWKGVVEMDMQRVSRDQHNTNILLGTSELRPRRNASSEEPEFIDEIVSKNGIHLKVIAPEVCQLLSKPLRPAVPPPYEPFMRTRLS